MPELYLDFETRSRCDLRQAGMYRYAEDPSTEALIASWALGDGPVRRWNNPRAGAPPTAPETEEWLRAAADPAVTVVAHNAEFEREILRRRFGTDLPPRRMACTAAQAARHGLPRHLKNACAALGLAQQKDPRGARMILKFSVPRRASAENPETFWTAARAPEDWRTFEEYAEQDVRAMRELRRALPQLEDGERRAWELTLDMNRRGVRADLAAVGPALRAVRLASARLSARFRQLTGASPASPLAREALGLPSLDKAHVRHALRRTDLAPRDREALEIRQQVSRSSVKKLVALQRQTCGDGRLRGQLIYSGAERTQRWSGCGVQPHNFPRGLGEGTDAVFDALRAGALGLLYGDEIRTVSEALKGFLVGPFLVGDFAQVEARYEAWLAGEEDLTRAFARGDDVYCAMASVIYGAPVTKADFDEALRIPKRQLGKVAVLACGYGLGPAKLREQLDEQFDVQVDEAQAERVVRAYRERHGRIVAFWRRLEEVFAFAVRNRARSVAVNARISAGWTQHGRLPFAYLALPSGRRIYYAAPRMAEGDGLLPRCERRYVSETTVSYLGRDLHTGKWGRVSTYGGKLTENAVQAGSRDLLLDAMDRVERAGLPLALTVHDEIVAEAAAGALPEFERIMSQAPPWAAGMPHKAEAFACGRYRK